MSNYALCQNIALGMLTLRNFLGSHSELSITLPNCTRYFPTKVEVPVFSGK